MRLRRIWVKPRYGPGHGILDVKLTEEFDAIRDQYGAVGWLHGHCFLRNKSSVTLIYADDD